MPAASETIATPPTDHVSFAADEIAWLQVGDIRSDLDDFSAKLMSDHKRDSNGGLRPFVPVVDVHVGTANSRGEDTNFDVVDARLGVRNIFEPQAPLGTAFDEGFHGECLPLPGSGSAHDPTK